MAVDLNQALSDADGSTQNLPFDPKVALAESNKVLRAQEQAKRGALPQDTLGAEFDPDNFAPTELRFDVSRGDTMDEKTAVLQKTYPEGELGIIEDEGTDFMGSPGNPIMLWRESPQSQWKRMNNEDEIDAGDVLEALGPSAEAMAGETVASVIAGRGKFKVGATIGLQVLGAALGEAVEQSEQYLLGTQRQSLSEAAGEVATETVTSGVGAVVGSPLNAVSNIAQGKSAVSLGDDSLKTLQAAERINPDLASGLTPGLISDIPAVQISERQASVLLPGIQRRYRELVDKMDVSVRKHIDPAKAAAVTQEVVEGMEHLQTQLLGRIHNFAKASDGGAAIQKGIKQFDDFSKGLINSLYDTARKIEEPMLDPKPLLAVASDLKLGSKGTLSPEVNSLIGQLDEIKGPIELSNGSVRSVADQYRDIRRDASSLAQPGLGEKAGNRHAQAAQLSSAIDGMINNPANSSPAFLEAWGRANKAYSSWRTASDHIAVVNAVKTQNPAELVGQLTARGQIDHVLAVRKVVSPAYWQEFQGAYYAHLVYPPAEMSAKLAKMDQETLDALMPRADQVTFKSIAADMTRIAKVGVDNIAERQVTNRRFIDRLIRSGEPRDVQTVMRAITETNNKEMRSSLRHSMMEWAWDGVVEQTPTTLSVNRELFASRISSLKENNMWRLLTPKQRSLMNDVDLLAQAFQGTSDAGTALIGASTVSSAQRLNASALGTFIRAGLLGQLYTSPVGRRMIIGSGLPKNNGAYIRLLSEFTAHTYYTPEDLRELQSE